MPNIQASASSSAADSAPNEVIDGALVAREPGGDGAGAGGSISRGGWGTPDVVGMPPLKEMLGVRGVGKPVLTKVLGADRSGGGGVRKMSGGGLNVDG